MHLCRDYAYSESRKSPTVDGIVERNRFGKERRQTERLTDSELAMASCVTRCFRQTVCGLDILRDGSKSYVIDVSVPAPETRSGCLKVFFR